MEALKYIGRRLLRLVLIVLGVTFLSFGMMRLAGGDAVTYLYENAGAAVSQEVLDQARAQYGLDKPFLVQYLTWLTGMLRGDMGTSYVSGNDVFASFASRLPATAQLAGASLLLTLLVSVPLGILAAVRRDRWVDYVIRFFSFAGNSTPNFLAALLLIYFFAIRLGWLPSISGGNGPIGILLPALTLSLSMSAKYTRQIRALVLEELSKGYVAGARARGIKERVILFRYVLRSALMTLVTLVSLSAGSLLGGTAVAETIFMWDGVGKLAVDAISMRDYPIVLAYVAWMAVIYVLINLVVDLLYLLLDPRVRTGGSRA